MNYAKKFKTIKSSKTALYNDINFKTVELLVALHTVSHDAKKNELLSSQNATIKNTE